MTDTRKPACIMIDRAGDVRLYEPDSFGGMDEMELTPLKWDHVDCVSFPTFEGRRIAAYRVFEEVRR